MNFVRFLWFFVLFAVTVADIEHFHFSFGIFKDRAHPGKCVYGDLILSPGEEGKPKGKCQRFACSRADGFGKIKSCKGMTSCKLADITKKDVPYPDCCMRSVMCLVL